MNTLGLLILIGMIIIIIYSSKKSEHEEYLSEVERQRQFKIVCNKYSNGDLLNQFGEEKFSRVFGVDALEKVKNNTDTEIVKILN